jgi:hypothetical protein
MAGTPAGGGGTGGAGGVGGPSIVQGVTDSLQEQNKALKTNNELIAQNPQLLQNVSLAEDEAAQKTNKFATALKEQALRSAEALSITNQLSGAITGFIGKLTEAAKLSKHYERMLTEVTEAQKLYLGSVNFSTKSMGDASAQMQKHITVLNRMKLDAVDLAKKYKVSVQEFDKVNAEVMGKFSTQIMAASKSQEKLKSIANTVFVMAKTAGMETGEAVEFMNQRASATAKTFLEVEKDTKQLAIATDAYKNKLKELGVDTQRTLMTSKQLVNVLQDMQKQFEFGGINLKVFGGMMGDFSAKLQAAGMSSNVAQKNLAAMGKLFADMSRPDLSDFFGTTVSMQIANTGGEGIIQDEKIKKRIKEQIDAAKKGGVTSPVQLASIAGEAAQGDIGFQRAQAQSLLKTTGGGGAVLHEMLKQKGFSGIGAVEAVNNLKKLASMTDEELKGGKKENKDMLEKFNKLQKATEEGSNPQADTYKAVVAIRNTTEKMERYVSQKLGIAVAAAVGGTIVTALATKFAAQKALGLAGAASGGAGGLLARLGGLATGAGGMVGRLIPGMAAGGGAAAGGGGMAAAAASAAGPVAIVTGIIISIKHMIDIHGKAIWAKIKGIGELIWSGLKPIVMTVGLAFKIVSDALKPVGDVLGHIIKAGLDLIKFAFEPVIGTVKRVMSVVMPIVYVIGKILVPIMKFLGEAAKGLVTVIKYSLYPVIFLMTKSFHIFNLAFDVVKGLLVGGFKILYGAVKPLISVFSSIGKGINEAIIKPLRSVVSAIISPFKRAGAAISKALSPVFGAFKKAGGAVGSVSSALKTLINIALIPLKIALMPLTLVVKGLSAAFKFVTGKLGGTGKILSTIIKAALIPFKIALLPVVVVAELLAGAFKLVVGGVKLVVSAFKWLTAPVRWLASKLGGLSGIISTVIKVGFAPLLVVVKAVSAALGLVKKAAEWVYNKTIGRVVKGVKKLWSGAKNIGKRLWGGAKKVGEGYKKLGEDIAGMFGIKKKEPIKAKGGIAEAAANAFKGVTDSLAKQPDKKEVDKKGLTEAGNALVRDYEDRKKALEDKGFTSTGASDMLERLQKTSRENASNNLTITPGSGEGTEDSQFKTDPTTGEISMKLPGSWVTIKKDDFKNSVAGVVTETLTKGT